VIVYTLQIKKKESKNNLINLDNNIDTNTIEKWKELLHEGKLFPDFTF